MGSLGIRAATVLDADRLAFVHGQCWKESHRALLPDELIESKEEKMKGIYPKELADPGATSYWVATWGGEIIGFAGATALGTGQERPLELTSLYVIADYQGRGIRREAARLPSGKPRAPVGHRRQRGIRLLSKPRLCVRRHERNSGRPGRRHCTEDDPLAPIRAQ